jgi:thioredoxin reductase (NADPH)
LLDFDCIIIGGGPAGLTTALYLARFRRTVLLIHAGASRVLMIPRTHNVAGFDEGVEGPVLLQRMHAHAEKYGAQILSARAERIEAVEEGWRIIADGVAHTARSLIFATGVVDRRLPLAAHDDALARGLLRYCPICDGFEASNKRIAIIGANAHARAEAAFLRTFSDDVTLYAVDEVAAQLLGGEAGACPIMRSLKMEGDRIYVASDAGVETYDTIYSCLGSDPQTDLASALGVWRDEEGCIIVDRHQRTNLAGVYAAGDVVRALDQIAVAVGQASIAATAIHNDLRAADAAKA